MTLKFEPAIKRLSQQKLLYYILTVLFTLTLFSTYASKAYAIPIQLTITCDPSELYGMGTPDHQATADMLILTGAVNFYSRDATGNKVLLTPPIEITPLGHRMSTTFDFNIFNPHDGPFYLSFLGGLTPPGEIPDPYRRDIEIFDPIQDSFEVTIDPLLPGLTLHSGLYNTGFDLVGFCEVTVPNPVPEPSTILLLGAGLVGLAAYGRKRIKK